MPGKVFPADQTRTASSSWERMLRNGVWNALGLIAHFGTSFVSVALLASKLGAELLGYYFTLFAVSRVLFLLLGGGISTVLTQRIANDRSGLQRHVGEAAIIWSLVSLASVAIFHLVGVIWTTWQVLPIHLAAFAMLGLSISGRHLMEFSIGAFRGVERFEFENVLRLLQAVLFAGGVFLLVPQNRDVALFWALFALTLSDVFTGLTGAIFLCVKWNCKVFQWRLGFCRNWFTQSLPLGVGDLLRRLTWQVDTFALWLLTSPLVVGVYSLAYRPLQPLQMIPRAITSVTFPTLARYATADAHAFARGFGQSVAFLWMASLAITLCIASLAPMLPLLDADFAEAVIPLQLLCTVVPFVFLSAQIRFALTALHKQALYMRIVLVVLAAKILLGALLISEFGIYGACASTVLAEVGLVLLGFVMIKRQSFCVIPWRQICRSGIVALVTFLSLWLFRTSPIFLRLLLTAVGIVVYTCGCIRLGAIDVELLRRLRHAPINIVARSRSIPERNSSQS